MDRINSRSVLGTELPAIPTGNDDPPSSPAKSTMSRVSSFFSAFSREKEAEPIYVEPNRCSPTKKKQFDKELATKEAMKARSVEINRETQQILQRKARTLAQSSIRESIENREERPTPPPRDEPIYVELLPSPINWSVKMEVQDLAREKISRDSGVDTEAFPTTPGSVTTLGIEMSPIDFPPFEEEENPTTSLDERFEPIQLFAERMDSLYAELSRVPAMSPRIFEAWS